MKIIISKETAAKKTTVLNCMKIKEFTFFNNQEIIKEIRLEPHELAERLKYFWSKNNDTLR